MEALLGHFSARCADAGVASKVLENIGLPSEQIQLEAQRHDLILLGQQTHFHFETQEAACRTLQAVLRTSLRPVVAVPERLGEPGSVVIAYDGSLQAARALQAFVSLGLGEGHAIHVVTIDADSVEGKQKAERAMAYLRLHSIQAEPHTVVATGPPGGFILEQAKQLGAGLLVLGAYGRPSIVEFFLGSVTRTILKESPIPMFLYH